MRALSLWEFWATGMREGLKHNETRGWYTKYRGDLVICAAKRRIPPDELKLYRAENPLYGKLYDLAVERDTFGKALCVVEVYDCYPSEKFVVRGIGKTVPMQAHQRIVTPEEHSLGNYAPGRWIIMTRNLRVLNNPVPVQGRQSMFTLAAHEEVAVIKQCPLKSTIDCTIRKSDWEAMKPETQQAFTEMMDGARSEAEKQIANK